MDMKHDSSASRFDASDIRGSSAFNAIGNSSKEMLAHYTIACANANAISSGALLASPRGATQQCKYKSGKCSNLRATKRNGQLHTLCHFHRVRQNEHQRKSDRKHRMVSVARRAKLGNMGLLDAMPRHHSSSRRSISSNASDVSSDARSTPASPMDMDRSFERQADGMFLNPFHLHHHFARVQPGSGNSTPTGRLPPISFLTQPGKLDSFRASSTSASSSPLTSGLALPPPSSFLGGGSSSAHAGKSA